MDLDEFMSINLQRVYDAIETAEVLAVGFSLFPQRVFLDPRFSEDEPPFISVVEPVESAEDRVQWLRRIRPQFAAPSQVHFFVWPRRIGSLESMGVWQRLVQRCLNSGHGSAAGACNQVLDELYKLERHQIQEAIHGASYRSLWERTR